MTRLPLAGFLFVAVALVPDCAAAAEVICDPDDPAKCSVELVKGDKAPFYGQLLTPKLSIALSRGIDDCYKLSETDMRFAKKEAKLHIEHEQSLRKSDATSCALEMDVMKADRDRWKAFSEIPFYREPWFIATVTAVGVGALIIGSTKLIQVVVPVR